MKKKSIRIRLTFYIVLLLTCVCILLTALSIYNANQSFVVPFLFEETETDSREERASVDSGESYFYMLPEETSSQAEEGSIVITQARRDFNIYSIGIMAAVIIGGGIMSYFLLGRALKPLRRLSGEIGQITENELSQHIDGISSQDEIGSLADSFNRMLERLDKSFSEQKRFSSDAAHELKTPLAVIKTNIDVLRLDETPEPEEYEKTLTVIERQLKRMMTLVDNLFAMTAQHSYDFNDTVDFDRMFRDIIAELTPRIREKNLEINLHHSGFHTIANSVMLTRAFSNLVENAVKYNIEGGRIDISTESEDKRYVITIADNGIGIPPEKLENIFKPFYRADESRSGTDGAGLGLAIASEIITTHGGTISARSQDGQTVFTVMLPII